MPLLPFSFTPISQRVADRVFGTTTLCQIATWDGLSVRVISNELSLELSFTVAYFGLVGGQPGPALPSGKGIESWHQTLYANNNCAVYLNPASATDPRNGQIMYYHSVLPGGGWEARAADGTVTPLVGGLEAAPDPVMKQGDAFFLSMNTPIALAQLIAYHLNAANQAPFNKFS